MTAERAVPAVFGDPTHHALIAEGMIVQAGRNMRFETADAGLGYKVGSLAPRSSSQTFPSESVMLTSPVTSGGKTSYLITTAAGV
ncbi:MAG: hypothetical protein EXR64_03460 [Dehalococcoidia bacterium]|nr:hypothetical protein [Dehalococcoidia bacterium]